MSHRKLKVMTILGTRPEIIKLSRVIPLLDQQTEHVLVHTGQNYDFELNEIFFEDLGIRKPDYFLGCGRPTAAEAISAVILEADKVLEKEKPEALLIYGDTNSCLSVIAAKRRRIPIFHMEAGNRCFDQRVPEEINRKIVDHLSDINMPLTEHARRYLVAEGLKPETVIKTGSTMREVIDHNRAKIDRSDVLQRLGLTKGKYFVVSAHREENVDAPELLAELLKSLNQLATEHHAKVIFSTHPRTQDRLKKFGLNADANSQIQFMKPLGFSDYLKLQIQSLCVLSDSGTITEEAALLKFPAVMLRAAHERPEGMDEGIVTMSPIKSDFILRAVAHALSSREHPTSGSVADYEKGLVSQKVVRLILSYTDYINRTVWYKL